jgi:hypothetical protein
MAAGTGKVYKAALVVAQLRFLNRLLQLCTTLAAAAIVARLAGDGRVQVASMTIDADWVFWLILVATFPHWAVGGWLIGRLWDIYWSERESGLDGPSSVLAELPPLGWYTHGILTRRITPSGRLVFRWDDPSIQVALASCVVILVGAAPWKVDGGSLAWSLPAVPAGLVVAASLVVIGANWRIGAAWLGRVAELGVAPHERKLSSGDGAYYDTDSFGSGHGAAVFSGIFLIWSGLSCAAGVLLGAVMGTWWLGLLCVPIVLFSPLIALAALDITKTMVSRLRRST